MTLWMNCYPPVHGILQARILEWVAMPSFRGLSNPGIQLTSLMFPALAGMFFTTNASWEALISLNYDYLFIFMISCEVLKGKRWIFNFHTLDTDNAD